MQLFPSAAYFSTFAIDLISGLTDQIYSNLCKITFPCTCEHIEKAPSQPFCTKMRTSRRISTFFAWYRNDIPSKVSLHDEDDPQKLDPSYTIILLIIPFYFILRRIHEFGILYSFSKSSKRLEQKREELKRKYKELKKVFGYEKVATVNEKNAIKKNTECIKLLQAWFIAPSLYR